MNRLTTLLSCCLFLAACAGNTRSYDLIPYPNSLEPRSGEFHAAGAPFTCDPQLDEAARKAVGHGRRMPQERFRPKRARLSTSPPPRSIPPPVHHPATPRRQ